VLDDGYKWRKYGQKVVKNSLHPSAWLQAYNERMAPECKLTNIDEL
jgi:hypothetical protein